MILATVMPPQAGHWVGRGSLGTGYILDLGRGETASGEGWAGQSSE
jgi:hypothetical protein